MEYDGAYVPEVYERLHRERGPAAGGGHVHEQRDGAPHGGRDERVRAGAGRGPVARPQLRARACPAARARTPSTAQATTYHQPAVRGELPARTRSRALRRDRIL